MAVALSKLSPAEKIMFGIGLLVAGVLVLVRTGTFAALWFLHHAR
jgi:hypothetical protein